MSSAILLDRWWLLFYWGGGQKGNDTLGKACWYVGMCVCVFGVVLFFARLVQ